MAHGINNKKTSEIILVSKKLDSWFTDDMYQDPEYIVPRFVLEHFKLVESMEDKSDEEMLLKIYNEAISAGAKAVMEMKGNLLAASERKEEAIEAYSGALTELENEISGLEKKEKIQAVLREKGIVKHGSEVAQKIKSRRKRAQDIKEKIENLRSE